MYLSYYLTIYLSHYISISLHIYNTIYLSIYLAKINKEAISAFGKSITKISESFSPIPANLSETNVLSYHVAKAQAK